MKKSTNDNPLRGFKVFCSSLLVALFTMVTAFGQTYQYQLVTENQTDWSGTYVMTGNLGNGTCMALSGITSGNIGDTLRMTSFLTGTTIASNTETDACQLTIAPTTGGHYTIVLADAYLGWTASNKLYAHDTYSDSIDEWDISMTDGVLSVSNVKDPARLIKFNDGSPRFACYTSAQTPISLYKYSEVVSLVTSAPTFSTTTGMLFASTDITLASATENATIYYTTDGSTPDNTSTLYEGAITVSVATTIKAIAYATGYGPSSVVTAVYTFPIEVDNIAAFMDSNTVTNSTVYKITGDVTFVYRNDRYMFVQDATAGMLIYDNNTPMVTRTYIEGDVISGGICGTYSLFKGLSEFIPVNDFAASTENTGAIVPTTVTIAELNADYDQYQAKLVQVVGATFNGGTYTDGSATNITIAQGDDQVACRSHFKNLDRVMTEGFNATVTGFVIRYNTTIQLAPRANTDITAAANALPFVTDFTTNTANVILNNGDQTNKWYVGQVQGFDSEKLFISSNNGISNKYDLTKASVSHATVAVNIPENGAVLSFDYRVFGESNSDYLQVSLLDPDAVVEAGTLPATYIARFGLTNDFTHYTYTISPTEAGNKVLVFTWKNDASAGTQYPAAVDNLSLIEATCAVPTNLAATVTGTTAVATWTAPADQTAWTFQYKLADHSEWYTLDATTTTVSLSNLQGNSSYMMRVKANCGEEESVWAEGTFEVPCLTEGVEPQNITIGTGTGTQSYFFGGGWGWYYTANLYDVADYGSINSLAFYLSSSNSVSGAMLTLWVKEVPSTFSLSSANTFESMKYGATLIYNDYPDYSSAGWKEFSISNGYPIAEGHKLLVLTKATGCTLTGGCSKSVRYTYNSNRVWYKYQDNTDPGENVGGYMSGSLPNMKINMSVVTCADEMSCPTPTNLAAANITANSAEIGWTAGGTETAWTLQYRADGGDWTSAEVTTNPYILPNLNQVTDYEIRLKANCNDYDESEYTDIVSFTTIGTCLQPTNLTYSNSNTTTTIGWTPAGTETQWVVRFKAVYSSDWVNLTVNDNPSTVVGGLMTNTLYDVEVKAVCSDENASLWTAGQFTSGCASFEVPFAENFGYYLPDCWTNDGFNFEGNATSTAIEQTLITPSVIVPSTGVTYITFDIKAAEETTENYQLLASFRGTAENNFYTIHEGSISGSNYQKVKIEVPQMFVGTNMNVMFKHVSGDAAMTIDNMLISQCPSTPSDLTASNITSTSVDLAWIAGAEEDNAWVIEYTTDGTTWTALEVGSNPYTVTDLAAATTYQFRVKTSCGVGNESLASETINVTTNCNMVSLPFTENFDGDWSCWTIINADHDYNTWRQSNTYISPTHSTPYAAHGMGNNNDWLITPQLILSGNATLSWWDRVESDSRRNSYSVLISTTGPAIENFTTTLASFDCTNMPWTEHSIDLSAYTGQNVYIAFHQTYSASSSYGFGIDDITVDFIPTCMAPTAVAANNVTGTTADISWTSHDNDASWNVQYGPTGFALGQGTTIVATTNSITLTDLAGSSSYDVYVQAVCSETDQSEWSDAVNFVTQCGAVVDFPFVEGFENGVPPLCWSREKVSGPGTQNWSSSSTRHSGSYSAYITDQIATTIHNLVTPMFNFSSSNNYQVKFWVNRASTYANKTLEGIRVFVNSAPNADNATEIAYIHRNYTLSPVESSAGWYEYTATIPVTGSQYLIFQGINEYGGSSYLDDITVEVAPTCFAPTALTVDSVTTSTAKIAWTANTAETNWNIQYGPTGFALGQGTIVPATNPFTLTGLSASTGYEVYVQAVCSETDQSAWSEVTSFGTECLSFSLPFFEGFEQTTFVPVCWSQERTVVGSGYASDYPYGAWARSTDSYAVHTGNGAAQLRDTKVGSKHNLVTPQLVSPAANSVIVSLWINRNAYSYYSNEGIEVWASDGTDLSEANNPVSLGFISRDCRASNDQIQSESNTGWYKYSLPIPKTGNFHIIFEGHSQYGSSTYIDDITIKQVVFDKDVKIALTNILDGCDHSNLPISATITNKGTIDTVRSFTVTYQVNDEALVSEDVTLTTPLLNGDSYTYTFNTLANLNSDTNVISVSVLYDGDMDTEDNTVATREIYNLDPIEVIPPYTQYFSNVTIDRMGWNVYDENDDEITWTNNYGTLTCKNSDEVASNEWLITPCFNLPVGQYKVTYKYNALSPMSENLAVYMGMGATPADMTTMVGSHTNFVQTASDVEYSTFIDITTAGTYNFGVYANSLVGNMGVTFDDFSITPMVNVLVTNGTNGTVDPVGSFNVPYGSNQILSITPDAMYHVAGVWVNDEQVVEEDMQNARFMTYTLDNITEPLTVNVTFNISQFVITGTVLNYADYGTTVGRFVPATDTVLFGDAYTATLVLNDHYHLNNFMVNNINVMADVVRNGNTYTYSFDRVWENKDIMATVRIDTVAVIYTVNGGFGTFDGIANTTESEVIYKWVNYGDDLLATVIPADGYHLVDMTVNNFYTIQAPQWQFNNIVEPQYINVNLAKDNYTITTMAYGNGTVSAGETFVYDPAHTYTFTAAPTTGNHIASILRNNEPLTITDPEATYTETLTNILTDYNYVVRFEPNTYTITATAGANGTVTPLGATDYFYNTTANYTITAATGYYIASVTIDGVTTTHTQADALNTTTLTFNSLSANHTVSATFAQYVYPITVTAGSNGAIAPATSTFAYGATPTFTITPATGYGIVDVLVDGQSVGAVPSYTFTALTAAHTISATFAQYEYTISATAGNGGSIAPAGVTNMIYDGDQTYTITPATGYHIDDVFVDGQSVGAVTTYDFTDVQANHTIVAAFALNEYIVTVTQPVNGAITPGTTTVAYGTTPTFVITPNTGYAVTAITLGAVNVMANATMLNGVYTYTLPAVAANQTLTATMTQKTYTITATAGANGTIAPIGAATVNYGANSTYTFTPDDGYVVSAVTVDGLAIGTPSAYTFVNIVANHTINVTFAAQECVTPSNLYTSSIDTTSATFNWYHPNAVSFDIQYKPVEAATFTTVNAVTGYSYEVTNLLPNTAYMWNIKANCLAGNESEWANFCNFSTPDTWHSDTTGIDDHALNNVKVYSVRNDVHIVNDMNVTINNVQIFSIYGQLIYTGKANANPEVISLNAANGTYIVRLATEQGMRNYKLYIGR